jgi:hypothetical protein
MNIEGERIFLAIAFGVHDASRFVLPRFLHRWNGCCELTGSVETGAYSAYPTAYNLAGCPYSEEQ